MKSSVVTTLRKIKDTRRYKDASGHESDVLGTRQPVSAKSPNKFDYNR